MLTRAFGVLVVLIVCTGVAETTALVMQHRVVDELSTRVQPLQLANADLRSVLADGQRGLRGYLLTGDGELLASYGAARTDFEQVAATLRKLSRDDEKDAVARQLAKAGHWWALAERQRTAPPRSSAAAGFVAQGKPLFQAFHSENQAFDAALAARAADLRERSATLGVVTTAVVVALTVLAAITAVLAAVQTARKITRPLARIISVIGRRRSGELDIRADATAGPVEIRAVAQAINEMAEVGDRIRAAEKDSARLRAEVRQLGYRIRAHLWVGDALTEAVRGLAEIFHADHVLVRMAPGQTDVPPLVSLRDEHAGGVLEELAGCDASWLGSGDVWTTDEQAAAGQAAPPEPERRAWAAVGDGTVLTAAVSVGDERLGALTLIRDGGPAWTPADVRLVEAVAADLGRGVHHARLFEREQHLVARLKELDTAKKDFMSTVSHELRTPLTSIAGYLELLLDADAGELAPPQRKMLEVIGRNTRRLRELIEDILILSKIESGSFRASRRPVDLTELAESAVAGMAPAAAKGEVELRSEVDRSLELTADPDQLDRVLTNLLSNAVKFTPARGTVTLVVRREADEIHVSVSDTGMGIPSGEQQGLFSRFFRASNAVHRAIPGTGLGLAIVHKIVENHGGHISVQSVEGSGTTVTIRLPAG
ncbi:ATP-binding protein [Couchioplanes caeruleus]|uniref:ATP-binding protein n=1 Tax=Couchioplanes caeruleus TaxID=56438 RepID=UPI001473B742|nr:ATP-binding protein [Couchioplanes caeruleus]